MFRGRYRPPGNWSDDEEDEVPDFSKDGYKPLFVRWLQEWKDESVNMQNNRQYSYANALRSLKKYPLPVYSGYGCSHIQFFGDFTCKKLEKKLTSYLKEKKLQRITAPDPFLAATSGAAAAMASQVTKKKGASRSPKKGATADNAGKSLPKQKRASKKAASQPSSREDGSGIRGSEETTGLVENATETEVPEAKPRAARKPKKRPSVDMADVSVIGDLPGDGPSSGNSRPRKISRVRSSADVSQPSTSASGISTQSVTATSRSASSDSIGATQRQKLLVTTKSTAVLTIGGGGGFTTRTFSSSSVDSSMPSTSTVLERLKKAPVEDFTLYPGSFDVVLCVDNQEIFGKGSTRSKTDVIVELQKQNSVFEVRKLNVGDFLWIAREKADAAGGRKPRELVLDFIAERKRGDDLASSIKDGRYTCQKFRMKAAGLKRVIYILEESSRFANHGIADQALHQALAGIEIQDHFVVKETANLRGTVDFLSSMTEYLRDAYAIKTLKSCSLEDRSQDLEFDLSQPRHSLLSFASFSAIAKSNQTRNASQAFLLQLLALDGMSPAKASAIVARFPTLRMLLAAYDECQTAEEKIRMLKDIKFGAGITSIGPVISKKFYQLYCTDDAFRF